MDFQSGPEALSSLGCVSASRTVGFRRFYCIAYYLPIRKLVSLGPRTPTWKEGRPGTYCTSICAHAPNSLPYNTVNQCIDENTETLCSWQCFDSSNQCTSTVTVHLELRMSTFLWFVCMRASSGGSIYVQMHSCRLCCKTVAAKNLIAFFFKWGYRERFMLHIHDPGSSLVSQQNVADSPDFASKVIN